MNNLDAGEKEGPCGSGRPLHLCPPGVYLVIEIRQMIPAKFDAEKGTCRRFGF